MKWEKVKLSEVTEYITDGDHQPAPKSDSGVLFVKIKDIQDNCLTFDNALFVPQEYYNQLPKNRKAVYGDTLYTVVGSYGIPAFVNHNIPFCFERNIALLHPNNRVIPKYLYYAVKNPIFYGNANNIANGSAQKLIPLSKLAGMEVSVPPIERQETIVNILSAYDELIENNQKQIKLLEEAAQRLYKEWFVDLRFPGHETTPIVDGVPEGWTSMAMNDIAEYINGYAFKPSDWGTKGKPIIKIKEMGSGITADTPRNRGEGIPAKYIVTAGDILFSWSATLSAMIWDEEDGLLNQHLFKVIPHNGISREFILQSILKALDEFSNLTTGSTMKHIQRGKLKEVFVNVPDNVTMRKYESISEPMREQILTLKKQIILLKEARDRLLPKLMSGEIEV